MKNIKAFLFIISVVTAVSLLTATAFFVGRLDGALNPSWTAEKAMCVNQDVAIRESPIGYVVGAVPAGEMVWFFRLDLPFAHIAYYNGSEWLEGTVPAFVLELCGQ